MWAHMFTECVRALYVDTSTWPTVPLVQPPPPPPQPVPPLPPLPPTEGTTAQPDPYVAIDEENLEVDF